MGWHPPCTSQACNIHIYIWAQVLEIWSTQSPSAPSSKTHLLLGMCPPNPFQGWTLQSSFCELHKCGTGQFVLVSSIWQSADPSGLWLSQWGHFQLTFFTLHRTGHLSRNKAVFPIQKVLLSSCPWSEKTITFMCIHCVSSGLPIDCNDQLVSVSENSNAKKMNNNKKKQ